MTRHRWGGLGLIAFAIFFNLPFSLLATLFSYPAILREPAAEILRRFAAGGPTLVGTWYMFMLAAVLLVPVVLLLRAELTDADGRPHLLATAFGLGAALFQAVGLARWVFVVPVLAQIEVDPAASAASRDAAHVVFAVLNQFAGVAIGEHLGQLFTAAWLAAVAASQWRGMLGGRIPAGIGFAAALLILVGLVEGFATVLPVQIGPLAAASPVGYVLLSVWLMATGVGLIAANGARATPPVPLSR